MTDVVEAARELAGVIPPEQLAVCRTCGQLRGSEGPYRQACACTPSDPERWRSPSGAQYDFNRSLELCYCCAAWPIRTGSRWAVYYCQPCKERVMALNRRVGAWVLPIGRHSGQHGNLLAGGEASDPAVVERFVAGMKSLFEAGTRVSDHASQWTLATIDRCGIPDEGDIPLIVYLERADAVVDRAASFEALIAAAARQD